MSELLSELLAAPETIASRMPELAALSDIDWLAIEGDVRAAFKASGGNLNTFSKALAKARIALEVAKRKADGDKRRALAERTGVPVFERGDAVEIAERLDAHFDTEDEPCVFDYGRSYRYDEQKGHWVHLRECDVSVKLQSWAGAEVETAKGFRPLRIDSDASPLKLFERRVEQRSPPAFFDQALPGVAFENLALIVKDGEIEAVDHSPELRALSVLPFGYNPDHPAPAWRYFLESTFSDERVGLLQEFVGGALIRAATHYDRAMIVFGGPGTGKSTFLKVIASLIPRERRCSVPPQKMSDSYEGATLAGKWLNIVYELPEHEVLEEDSFKAIVVGEEMQRREPYGRPFTFTPLCAHLFAANDLPNAPGAGRAFWDRWLVVPFERRFRNTPEQRRDLASQIIAEELPAVAAWALDGAVRLLKNDGYAIPTSSADALEEWQQEANPIAMWARECVKGEGFTSTKDLHVAWKAWAKDAGHHGLARNTFGRRLAQFCPKARGPDGARGFAVKLLSDDYPI